MAKKRVIPSKLPTTWEEFCQMTGRDPLKLPDTSVYDDEDKKHAVADFKLTHIIRYCNGGNLEYTDNSTVKYEVWMYIFKDDKSPSGVGLSYGVCDDWAASTSCGPRFAFVSRPTAEHIFEHFLDLIKDLILV